LGVTNVHCCNRYTGADGPEGIAQGAASRRSTRIRASRPWVASGCIPENSQDTTLNCRLNRPKAGVALLPPDGAAQETVAERGEGGALAVVLAVAVAAGGGLVEIGFVAHRLQFRRHFAGVAGMDAVLARLVAIRIDG